MRSRPPLIVECRIPPRIKAPPARLMARWAEAALGPRGAGHEMAVQVVSPARMRVLNRRYRGKDCPTNVLAFPAQATKRVRPKPLGDVVVCAAVLRREARVQGKREIAHWAHLVVHGTLHLAGYDHQNEFDAARMERREIAVLRRLGFGNPYTVTEVAAKNKRRTSKHYGRGRRQ
jgi:probable rRNA maturation factor